MSDRVSGGFKSQAIRLASHSPSTGQRVETIWYLLLTYVKSLAGEDQNYFDEAIDVYAQR